MKNGGTLVYSTCSISPHENEEVVRYALDNLPLKLEKQNPFIGFSPENTNCKILDEEERKFIQKFIPSKNSHSGFFISKFVKKKN